MYRFRSAPHSAGTIRRQIGHKEIGNRFRITVPQELSAWAAHIVYIAGNRFDMGRVTGERVPRTATETQAIQACVRKEATQLRPCCGFPDDWDKFRESYVIEI